MSNKDGSAKRTSSLYLDAHAGSQSIYCVFGVPIPKENLVTPMSYGRSWLELAMLIKDFPLTAVGTLSIEEAFVTGGGVNLKEINPSTMQSKLMDGLFFCGEVIDVHGYTGGYNITAAFTTGYNAGKSAAEAALL